MQLFSEVSIIGPWAWKLMGNEEWHPKGKAALGEIINSRGPVWAVVYDHYETDASIQMHIAISNPKYVTRQAIQAVFEYPFKQLGVKKVFGFVNSENAVALEFARRLGFTVDAVIQGMYKKGDTYILSMARKQCRWLRGQKNG